MQKLAGELQNAAAYEKAIQALALMKAEGYTLTPEQEADVTNPPSPSQMETTPPPTTSGATAPSEPISNPISSISWVVWAVIAVAVIALIVAVIAG